MGDSVYTLRKALRRLSNPDESTLIYIGLSGKGLGDDGAKSLANSISNTNAPIQDISLFSNGISDEGAKELANSIAKTNAPITVIGLSYNKIGDEGAKALANSIIATASPIQTIRLSRNQIGDEGATAIETGLRYNDTITDVRLDGNYVSQSIINNIAELCQPTPERKAAVAEWRKKYPIIVGVPVDDIVTDDEEHDMSTFCLSVEI